jgi:hypothetical protein
MACSWLPPRAARHLKRGGATDVNHLPLIVIEVVLVFGGAVAFAWWQFRDLARERKKREDAKQDRSST